MDLNEAEQLAKDLIKQYNIPYSFAWNNSRNYIGRCFYLKKVIELSKPYTELNDEKEIRDTILHEIAHALAPKGSGHGPKWKQLALSLGCKPHRCADGQSLIIPPYKYLGHCPNCKRIIKKNKRARIACGKCCSEFNNGQFSEKFIIKWDL